MAVVHVPGAPFDPSMESTSAPLVVLFERDDGVAVPLLSQIRLAGYDVRASRTPVELFDTLGKHLVSLVLVDLGNATAGRREFWVALDAQRRGRALQVMTFRYTQPSGLFDADFEPAGRAVADVEVRGPQEFALIVEGIRQRIPLAGGVEASAPGFGALGGMPQMGLGVSQPAFGADPVFGVPQPYAPLGQPQMGYAPVFGAPGAQPGGFPLPAMQPNPLAPPPADPYGYAAQPFPAPQAPFGPSPFGPSPFGPSPFGPTPFGASPFGQPEAASPFAQPMESNPFAAEEASSAFARPLDANPFAMDSATGGPTMRQPAMNPFAAPEAGANPFGRAPTSNPFGGAPSAPASQPHADLSFEERAAHLSANYAAQFGIPDPQPVPSAPAASPFGSSPRHTWGGPSPRQADPWGAPGFSAAGGFDAHPAAAAAEPPTIADAWTPPDGEDLNGQTGVVPELANVPLGGHSPWQPEPRGWSGPHLSAPQPTERLSTPQPAAPRSPAFDAASTPAAYDSAPLQETVQVPTPPSHRALVPTTPAETALGNVLVEGALLTPQKLEALKGVQQMLASVDMNFKIGDLALLFKFLSPDQLLAALLVSRGYVSPQQIAGLGRVKQELNASGMDYDLETLLSMFHILSPEQLRQIRADLH